VGTAEHIINLTHNTFNRTSEKLHAG